MVSSVLLRSVVLTLVFALPRLLPVGAEDGLGLGLAVFTVLAAVSLVWAFLDGRRAGLTAVAVRWAVVAVVVGLATSVLVAVPGAGWSDVAAVTPVVAALVAVPAAVGLLVGALVRRVRVR